MICLGFRSDNFPRATNREWLMFCSCWVLVCSLAAHKPGNNAIVLVMFSLASSTTQPGLTHDDDVGLLLALARDNNWEPEPDRYCAITTLLCILVCFPLGKVLFGKARPEHVSS